MENVCEFYDPAAKLSDWFFLMEDGSIFDKKQ